MITGDGAFHGFGAIEDDVADGFFSFRIAVGTPAASPAATPVATPLPATPTLPASSIAIEATATATPGGDESDFDSGAFGLAVLAGVVVAVGIYLFWRLVRPKPGR